MLVRLLEWRLFGDSSGGHSYGSVRIRHNWGEGQTHFRVRPSWMEMLELT
jgi:hypothetical protein